MSNELYIEEYSRVLVQDGARIPVPVGLITTQKVSVSAGSSQSAALNENTKFVLLTSDVASQFELGSNPTADADSRYLPADGARFISAKGGDKIAVIEQQ